MLPFDPSAPQPHPLWRLGFRPFFLAGSAFALLAIAYWLGVLTGHAPALAPAGSGLAWHRHEMIYGFGGAIIAGFLLTAVTNWTGRPGTSGPALMMLFGAWLLARLAWFSGLPVGAVAVLQLSVLPLLALHLGAQLWAVRQKRNYPVVFIVLLLAASEALNLAGVVRGDDGLQRQGALAALWLIAALMGLIGGRVIPFFTQRGLGRDTVAPPRPRLDVLGLGCAIAVAALNASGLGTTPQPGLALLFGLIALLHGQRLVRWYDAGIWRVPLLWSLHVAYAWLMVAAIGTGLWHLGLLENGSLASHALSVGGMGGLILAMMARVSLGHTGRPLEPPRSMNLAFASLHLATCARIGLVPFVPVTGFWLAGSGWLLAFGVFLGHYAPLFWRARADGRPG